MGSPDFPPEPRDYDALNDEAFILEASRLYIQTILVKGRLVTDDPDPEHVEKVVRIGAVDDDGNKLLSEETVVAFSQKLTGLLSDPIYREQIHNLLIEDETT